MASEFEIRGVVEGFYGAFYTWDERIDLIRFLGRNGYNYYVYGPKNDRQHRLHWRRPYPEQAMRRFAGTVAAAQQAGVTFCYAISPGASISYASDEDFRCLQSRCLPFYELGVRAFSLLLDDIDPAFQHSSDGVRYHSYGAAHVDLSNRLYAWLQTLGEPCTMSMCPTDYHGRPPFSPYLHELGEGLRPEVDVFYTGPAVCSVGISTEDAQAFADVLRRPPLLWDNYPVNDVSMQSEMHIGPIRGRAARLAGVTRGILVNPMNQAEASKIPLRTWADYFDDPQGYDPQLSWQTALARIAGDDSYSAMRRFAENSLYSCLRTPEAEQMGALAKDALLSLRGGDSVRQSQAVRAFREYLTSVDEACSQLQYSMGNIALRNNLLPWIDLLEQWAALAQGAMAVIDALEQNRPPGKPAQHMMETYREVAANPKRMAGTVILPLVEYAIERVARSGPAADTDRVPAPPPYWSNARLQRG